MRKLLRLVPLFVILACLFLPLPAKAATTDGFWSSQYDGFIFSQAATYAGARDPTSWAAVEASSTGVSFTVGEDLSGGIYTVCRSVLFFNTSSLPSNITITGVTLSLWARTITATDHYSVSIVEAGDQTQPIVYSGFTLFQDTEYSTRANTEHDDFSTAAYLDIALTPDGYDLIQTNGITILGLRSSMDIDNGAPTGSSYIEIWSSESAHSPKLTVTYTLLALGNPNILKITNAAVFTSYLESGDQLYVFGTDVEYSTIPEVEIPGEYFTVKLDDSTTMGETLLQRWGFGPLSIYLNPSEALTWSGSYDLIIVGTDMFGSPPSFTYTLVEADWKGEAADSDYFRQWIYTISDGMEEMDGISYRDTSNSSLLNSKATAIFTEGIPCINSLYPDRFVVVGPPLPQDKITPDDTYSGTLYDTWGSYWTDAFDGLGDAVGIPGYWIVSLLFAGLSIGAVVLLGSRGMSSPLVYLAPLPIMMLGCLVGVPVWIATIAAVFSIAYFAFNVYARGLSG